MELQQCKESTAKDILKCGADEFQDLLLAAQRLSEDGVKQECKEKIASLIDLAHRRPARIVPVEVGRDYRRDDWTQRLIDWDDFLTLIASPREHEVVYLAQHNIMRQFPALRDDIVVPDYAYTALPPPESFPRYKPPSNEEELVINAWFGQQGTESPAHTDPFFNLYAQVVGRKTVWLAPPSATQSMYAYPPAEDNSHHNPAANTTEPSLSNTSQVDVFASHGDSSEKHPDFWEKVVPHALYATLEPGDLLFFPPGWWHAMRSEERSFSVSMWF
ncbi:hypothetical protein HWV62_44953 [Athelia sp. TMB]|nr:hypothetical protein HWV62_44953 [Athelia sp. TMB]